MTGTFLTPFENFSISSSFTASALTSKYTALSPKTDLAFSVCGQPAFPKMMIFPAMSPSRLALYYYTTLVKSIILQMQK
jgi:hypothetical protein